MRREAFLDVAQRLIVTKGYDRMSIQDVLDELETSRGALYHYFDSKQALLDGVVNRLADEGLAPVASILGDRSLPALRKLERVLGAIASFKAGNVELVLAIVKVWSSDGNALVRERLRALSAQRLLPILSTIISQGAEEGIISTSSPEETARVILYLIQGYQQLATEQLLGRQAGTVGFNDVLRSSAAFTVAFERILGIPSGSVTLADEPTLRFWYG